ncbi:DUF192 domain-containing protein [Telmatospirillum sp. J64-1]|uniref:DUF192 domain-containing protein n=1 Tax=Telmatospirillum sp. J64-1 TaxID=2502183 RepID=UPI00115E7ECD|nr:DUF192 domain-containing protein [Telmatospirillum sp. J64-1]
MKRCRYLFLVFGLGLAATFAPSILTLRAVEARAEDGIIFSRSTVAIETQGGARHVFDVELALTPEQRAQGLMFRRELAEDHGMLFDFGSERTIHMWMKNTLIPLDMLFLSEEGRVIGLAERTEPLSLEVISGGPARYVLELAGGTAERLGLRPGDRMSLPEY